MNELKIHPVAEMFPMMSDEELDELAADIQANGLLHPIVVDADHVLIDGRNRLEACRRVGVEPSFATLNGEDPVAFILSNNLARRHLTQGQKAMLLVLAERFVANRSTRAMAEDAALSQSRVVKAVVVREHAKDLVHLVLCGDQSLDQAYHTALERKALTESQAAKLERLRKEAPDLADLVAEERMSLEEGMAALKAREEKHRQDEAEQKRQVLMATRLFGELLNYLEPRGMTPAEHAEKAVEKLNLDSETFLLMTGGKLTQRRMKNCLEVLQQIANKLARERP